MKLEVLHGFLSRAAFLIKAADEKSRTNNQLISLILIYCIIQKLTTDFTASVIKFTYMFWKPPIILTEQFIRKKKSLLWETIKNRRVLPTGFPIFVINCTWTFILFFPVAPTQRLQFPDDDFSLPPPTARFDGPTFIFSHSPFQWVASTPRWSRRESQIIINQRFVGRNANDIVRIRDNVRGVPRIIKSPVTLYSFSIILLSDHRIASPTLYGHIQMHTHSHLHLHILWIRNSPTYIRTYIKRLRWILKYTSHIHINLLIRKRVRQVY